MASKPPLDGRKSVDAFCIATTKLMHIDDNYAKKRKPLADRVDEIKTQIKQYMQQHKLTCLPVTITEIDYETNKPKAVERYLRIRHTSSIGKLGVEGIERAVMSVTSDDLKEQYAVLRETQAKAAKKKPTKKRKKTEEKSAPVAEAPKSVTILDVWEAVVSVKIRREHLHESESLKIDASPERGMENVKAPVEVQRLAQEWYDKSRDIDVFAREKQEASVQPSQVVKEQETAVARYLERANPSAKAEEVILKHRGESRPFMLKTKESRPSVDVRITAFKPYIRQSLQDTLSRHAQEVQTFSAACSEAVKHDIVNHLLRQYQVFQEEHQKVEKYVALDKVPVRKEKSER